MYSIALWFNLSLQLVQMVLSIKIRLILSHLMFFLVTEFNLRMKFSIDGSIMELFLENYC